MKKKLKKSLRKNPILKPTTKKKKLMCKTHSRKCRSSWPIKTINSQRSMTKSLKNSN